MSKKNLGFSRTDIENYIILLCSHELMHIFNEEPSRKHVWEMTVKNKYIRLEKVDCEQAPGRTGNERRWQHNFQNRISGLRNKKLLKESTRNNWYISPSGFRELLKKSSEYSEKEEDIIGNKGTYNLIDKISKYREIYLRYKMNEKKFNRLVSGAPGTGKSHMINEDAKNLCSYDDECYTRVTFYPEYNYSQFVGVYKPTTIYSDELDGHLYSADNLQTYNTDLRKPYIDYTVVAGPFLEMLCKALSNKDKKYVLIIEEINRANASAVFGDLFQLLDRDSNGRSKYEIRLANELMEYVGRNSSVTKHQKIYLPENLYIWATMNSADQNIEPLDSAFKRRWSPEYISIDSGKERINEIKVYIPFIAKINKWNDSIKSNDRKIKWNDFRELINERISNSSKVVKEDKLIGPFFISREEFERDDIQEIIKSKLIIYLRDDVLKSYSNEIFNIKYNKNVEMLLKAYGEGNNIFNISEEELIKLIPEEKRKKTKEGPDGVVVSGEASEGNN